MIYSINVLIIVFDKNTILSPYFFFQNVAFIMKLTHIQVLIKKKCMKLEFIYFCRGSVLSFDILYVQIFILQNYSEGHKSFVKIIKKAGTD